MRLAVPSSAGWPVCWFASPLVGGSAPSLRPFSVSVSAGVAHKGGNWATLGRTQGLDPALVCGSCFVNRGPCVRTPRGWRTIRSSPPGAWPWCGCFSGQWAWSIASTSIASAARPALARVFHWAVGVVGRVRSVPGPGAGAPPGVDARCRHREGVVDIVRGLSTPRGGYNARRCQQRASVPISHAECQQRAPVRTTRAHANNARRRPRPGPPGGNRSPRPGPSSAQPSLRRGHPAVTAVRARGPRRRSAVTAAHARGHPAAAASKKAAAATRRCRPPRARAPGRRRRRGAPRRAPRAPGPRCPRPLPLPCS